MERLTGVTYMIVDRISLDTNVLIYAFDQREKKRQKIALQLIEAASTLDCVLTLQALSEFYYATTRKKYLTHQLAQQQIDDFQTLFTVAIARTGTLQRAVNACSKYQLSFWDAMLWATARDAGVSILLSEDYNHDQEIAGIKIINPFVDHKIMTSIL